MKKKCANDDRFSELPDSLILDILRFLLTTEVVRTTILSQRWKNLWTTIPWLDFDESRMMINSDKFQSFVHGALDAWRGIEIKQLKLEFLSQSPTTSDIDSLVKFATENKVEDLSLLLPNSYTYLVPQHLYSCSSLEVLRLQNCNLQVNGNVRWDKLERLAILSNDIDEKSINQIVRGSPRLKRLVLILLNSKENLISIRSTSLKTLAIAIMRYTSVDSEVRIWNPNLKTFRVKGDPFCKCSLMNVSSLSKAHLEFVDDRIVGEGLMGQILPALENVKRLTLSHSCIKAIGAAKEKYSPLPSVKYLKLQIRSQEYQGIVSTVLQMFPKLRDLVLDTFENRPKDAKNRLKFGSNLSYVFLHELRRVDITWIIGDDSIFPLIEILLKYAIKLKKLYFRVKRMEASTPWEPLFMASQKLLRMPRSSQRAKLIIDHHAISYV